MTPSVPRPGYGIDAPGLVRTFFLVGLVAICLAAVPALAPWPGGISSAVAATLAGLVAGYCLGLGSFMVHFSLRRKVRERETLLDLLPWTGGEAVLDVGCGRGLLLVAAARRVPNGRAVGIDVWRAEDQADNRPDATLANARAEGVEGRVQVLTADMRQLPFPDATFDAVVSHWAVHNLYAPDERAKALDEIARVLKPGGRVLLADIEHHAEYAARLAELGFVEVRHEVSRVRDAVLKAVTFGSFRPGAVVGRKAG